jgi:hypothetical protein
MVMNHAKADADSSKMCLCITVKMKYATAGAALGTISLKSAIIETNSCEM